MREILLCLKGGTLYGLWRGQEVKAPLYELPWRGEAVLLLDGHDLWHRVLSLPPSPHLDVRRLMEHEAREALGDIRGQVLRWRRVARGEGGDLYLLMAAPKERVAVLAEGLARRGVYLQRALSPLDLLAELGGRWAKGRNCCVLLIDGQEVTILLFARGGFVFWRGFELAIPVGDPQVADELATELRRSALYLLQEFKVRAEAAVVVSPPGWLTEEVARDVSARSGVGVELLPLPGRASPWLALMEEGREVLSRLPSLLPGEAKAALFLRRRRVAVALGSLLLAVACLCWAGLRYLEYRSLGEVLEHSREVMRLWEPLLERRKERIEQLRRLRAEREGLFRRLEERSFARVPLEVLGYLVPEGAYLERVAWQREGEKGVLVMEVKVEPEELSRRYALYRGMVEGFRGVPFVEEVLPDTSRLLGEGAFTLTVVLKEVKRGA